MAKSGDVTFMKVLETYSASDVALIKSVLDGQDIQYYLQGENTLYLRPVDPVLLMVAEEDAPTVAALLKDLDLKGLLPFAPNS